MGSDLKRRIVIYCGVVVVALAFLVPTLFRGQFDGSNWISKPLSLGLDLQGGVYLVYEVEVQEAVKSQLQSMGSAARRDLRSRKVPVQRVRATDTRELEIVLLSNRSVDEARQYMQDEYSQLAFERQEQNGAKASLFYSISDQEARTIEKSAVDRAIETLRNRVDQFGVSEPLIQKVGT
jgi:preprotein translocase subunit SecD